MKFEMAAAAILDLIFLFNMLAYLHVGSPK